MASGLSVPASMASESGGAPIAPGPGTATASPVDLYIRSQDDRVRPLLQAARQFLHEAAPGLTEAMKWRRPTFMQDRNRFFLNAEDDHIILGFTDGARMPDHHDVFDEVETEGASVRIRTAEDLQRPGLREAVRAAAGFRPGR